MRLNKFLAKAGLGSRRCCDELIQSGKVMVNGSLAVVGLPVDEEHDIVSYNGKNIKPRSEELICIAVNKPKDVIVSKSDPQNRKIVYDILPKEYQHFLYAGRLDKNTEGLLLLSNNGDFINELAHPSFEIDKEYEVVIRGESTPKQLETLRSGVSLEDGVTSEAKVKVIKKINNNREKISITIHEGKNRQVRRMFKSVKLFLLSLKRVRIGNLLLKGIESGDFRVLSPEEIKHLKDSFKV